MPVPKDRANAQADIIADTWLQVLGAANAMNNRGGHNPRAMFAEHVVAMKLRQIEAKTGEAVTTTELADSTGIPRSTVSVALGHLLAGGVVMRDRQNWRRDPRYPLDVKECDRLAKLFIEAGEKLKRIDLVTVFVAATNSVAVTDSVIAALA